MAGFLSRGRHRDVFFDEELRQPDIRQRPSTAVDAPDLGPDAFFDPVTQTVFTGERRAKERPREEEQRTGPEMRKAKPEDQLAFFERSPADDPNDPTSAINRKAWLQQFHKTANKRRFRNLADWLKFVSSVRGQGVENLGTQNIQGTIQKAAIQFMPRHIKREFDRLESEKKFRSDLRRQRDFEAILLEESARKDFDIDPKTGRLIRRKAEKPSGAEKIAQGRSEQLQDIRSLLAEQPNAIAVVEKGERFEALRNPKKIRIVPADFLQQRDASGATRRLNSAMFEELDLGQREEAQAEPQAQAARPSRLATQRELENFMSELSLEFPDISPEEVRNIRRALVEESATPEEIIEALAALRGA